jgi:hypothetical protein
MNAHVPVQNLAQFLIMRDYIIPTFLGLGRGDVHPRQFVNDIRINAVAMVVVHIHELTQHTSLDMLKAVY